MMVLATSEARALLTRLIVSNPMDPWIWLSSPTLNPTTYNVPPYTVHVTPQTSSPKPCAARRHVSPPLAAGGACCAWTPRGAGRACWWRRRDYVWLRRHCCGGGCGAPSTACARGRTRRRQPTCSPRSPPRPSPRQPR